MAAASTEPRWLEPLRATRLQAGRLWQMTSKSLLDRLWNLTLLVPGARFIRDVLERVMEAQENPFASSPPAPIQVTELGSKEPDKGRSSSEAGDEEEEIEMDLSELVEETVELLTDASVNMASLMDDLGDVSKEQRAVIIDCCRYFHEIYEFLSEE